MKGSLSVPVNLDAPNLPAQDLPENARDYVRHFAGLYFEAMGEWFGLMKPGVAGGEIWHLIHLDEWVSSPIYRNSDVTLHSGMAIQLLWRPSRL